MVLGNYKTDDKEESVSKKRYLKLSEKSFKLM